MSTAGLSARSHRDSIGDVRSPRRSTDEYDNWGREDLLPVSCLVPKCSRSRIELRCAKIAAQEALSYIRYDESVCIFAVAVGETASLLHVPVGLFQPSAREKPLIPLLEFVCKFHSDSSRLSPSYFIPVCSRTERRPFG
jgi:hypothetical protein